MCKEPALSELVGIDIADYTLPPEGLIVQLKRSKTDQEEQGRQAAFRAAKSWNAVPSGLGRIGDGRGRSRRVTSSAESIATVRCSTNVFPRSGGHDGVPTSDSNSV